MARPSKYSAELTAKICELLAEGLSTAKVCDLVGINPDTFTEWNKSNPEFSEAIKKAKAENERWHLAQIRTGAREGHWQASAWYLERTQPATYGRVQMLPAPLTENSTKTKLDKLIEGFEAYIHAPDEPDEQGEPDTADEVEADNGTSNEV